jgi:hypothetical protein
MEVVNVVGIEFVDNGRSLRLEIVESIPPHVTSYVTFRNTYGIKFFQAGGEEFPMVVIDLSWRTIPDGEKQQLLSAHQYPILDELQRPFVVGRPIVASHFEGAIVGDVFAEEVVVGAS